MRSRGTVGLLAGAGLIASHSAPYREPFRSGPSLKSTCNASIYLAKAVKGMQSGFAVALLVDTGETGHAGPQMERTNLLEETR